MEGGVETQDPPVKDPLGLLKPQAKQSDPLGLLSPKKKVSSVGSRNDLPTTSPTSGTPADISPQNERPLVLDQNVIKQANQVRVQKIHQAGGQDVPNVKSDKNSWNNVTTFAPQTIAGGLEKDAGDIVNFLGNKWIDTFGGHDVLAKETITNLANKLENRGVKDQQYAATHNALPNTTAGGVATSAINMAPTLAELAVTPELDVAKIGKLGEVLTKYGGKYAPKVANLVAGKFPTQMAATGLAQGYSDAKRNGATENEANMAGLLNSAEQGGKGVLYEAGGAAAGKFAKYLGDAAESAGAKGIPLDIGKRLLHSAAQATAFSAVPFITNSMEGKPTSLEEWKNNAILGGLTGLFHGEAKDGSTAADGAAKEILQRSPLIDLNNFMDAHIDAIKGAHAMDVSPEDLHLKAAAHAEKAFQSDDPEEKQNNIVQSSLNGKLASVKSVTQAILKDKDALINSLPDGIDKQPIIDKINEVHKALDPTEHRKTELADKIKEIQDNPGDGIIEQKENKLKLNDLNKELDGIIQKQHESKQSKELPAETSKEDAAASSPGTDGTTNEEITNNQTIKTKNHEKGQNGHAEEGQENGGEEITQKGDAESSQNEKGVLNVTGGEEPPVNQKGEENATNKEQIEKIGGEEHQERNKSGETATSSSDSPVSPKESEGQEKPRYKIKGDVITKLPLDEHSELNTILKKEDGIDISHLKDVINTQRDSGGKEPTEANANAKTVQQPSNDSPRNDGENRPGEGTEKPKGTAKKATFKKPAEQVAEPEGGKNVKKTILTKRAYEGEVQPEVKKYLEEKGLTRKSYSQEERSKQGSDFINKFGEDAAFRAVEAGDIDGGLASSILVQLHLRNSDAIEDTPENSDERDELAKKDADIIALMEKKGYFSGEYIGQLAHEYQNKEMNFASIKRQVEKMQKKPLTKVQETKVKETIAENEKLKKALKDAEAKLIEETDKAFEAGKQAVKDETKTEKAKRIADKIRQGKVNRPGVFSSATPGSLAWDTAVEIVAKSVEAGGKIADAVQEGINHIKSTDWYKGLSKSKQATAEAEFKRSHNYSAGSTDLEDLQSRFADKTDKKFTPAEARDIWGYMKENYLNNGMSYQDALSKTAQDLGLSWRQTAEAVTTPKLKRVSDEMWKRNSELARNRSAIKTWIGQQDSSAPVRAWKKISGLMRGIATFGHGHIFLGTHAGMTFFNPSTWNKTIPAYLRGFKLAYGKEADYEKAMQELKNEPNYLIAQRAGLKNDPDRINVEEYQKSQQYLGRLGHVGERGFNTIKVLRQNLFDYHFNRLSPELKDDPEVAKSIAQLVNLATGATNLKLPSWVNEISFAGGMEASRWEKLLKSPAKSAGILAKVIKGDATPSERVFAKVWARRVGEQLATYTTGLVINAAINNYLFPDEKKKLFDPTDPNWWKYKFGKHTIDPTSGMRSTGAFLGELITTPFKTKAENYGKSGLKAEAENAEGYARGKLAPLYSTISDFVDKKDFSGNIMPSIPHVYNTPSEKPSKGKEKLSWLQYSTSKLPLPVAEAFGVFYQSALEHGAHPKQLNSVIDGILSGGISGATGFRVGDDSKSKNGMKKPGLLPKN